MKLVITYIAILFTYISFTHEIKINFVIDSYNVLDDAFQLIIEEFNKYANETEKDIQLEMTYFTDENDGDIGYNDYDQTLKLFGKKKHRYDLFAYDPLYLKVFSPYLLDLKNYPELKDYLDLYSTSDNIKLTEYNGHRIGLPLFMIISVLQSNDNYLKKYKKDIPKTWDELIKTTEDILEQEKDNNPGLIGYNGLFPKNENALCSFYQIIYSYREDKELDFPEFDSQTAIDAVEEIKNIQNTISSNEIFKFTEIYIVKQMLMENIIFVNFYSSARMPNYTISALPGKKEGINGSIIGGFNLGINKDINDERKKASIEVLKFLFSEKFQKEVIVKKLNLITALSKLYDDNECCNYINCEMMKEIQFYQRPSSTMKDYGYFSKRFLDYFYKYLDGLLTSKEMLKEIVDINKIYFITTKSVIGKMMLCFLLIIFCCIILSVLMVFIPKYKNRYFGFLNSSFWIIYILGSFTILLSIFEYYNIPSDNKCILRHIFMEMGYSMVYIPILYKLICNYPKSNNFSNWIKNNQYIYATILLSVQILLSIISEAFSIYKTNEINFYTNNKNFYVCDYSNLTGKLLSQFQTTYNLILYFAMCFLIFLEWNLSETFYDLRHFSLVLFIDGLNQLLIIIFHFLNINYYILYNLLYMCVYLISLLMNIVYMFFIRLIIEAAYDKFKLSEENKMNDYIKNNKISIIASPNSPRTTDSYSNPSKSKSSNSRSSVKQSTKSINYKSKFIRYHYSTSIM